MFTVTDSVIGKSNAKTTLYPYAYVVRDGAPQSALNAGYMTTLHEGFVGYGDGLKDPTTQIQGRKRPPQTFSATGGWIGITDKYWMATVIPPQNENFDGGFRAMPSGRGPKKPIRPIIGSAPARLRRALAHGDAASVCRAKSVRHDPRL